MQSLMNDNELVNQINEYPDHNYIWIEIWEANQYEIQLVVTVNNEKMIKFHHKVFLLNSLFTDEESPEILKNRGREVRKLLKSQFKNSEIHSNLRYRG